MFALFSHSNQVSIHRQDQFLTSRNATLQWPIAIIGAGGNVGKHMTQAFFQTGKHTRASSPPPSTTNEESLVEALKGQQFLIVSLAVSASAAAEAIVMSATAKAGVPWVMPTCYGTDMENKKLMEENLTGQLVFANIAAAERAGLSWTTMNYSFWYEFSLSSDNCYGINIAKRMATLFGGGTVPICTSTWLQCGRAAAAFLSLKVLPEAEHDADAKMSRWRDRPLFIKSFVASQQDMLDSVHGVLGTTDADWTVAKVDAQARYDAGRKLLGGPEGHKGFSHCLYTRTFFQDGGGDFSGRVVKEALGLPEEGMDEATRRAVDMAMKAGDFEYAKGAD
ncbi:NAD(P)-binding domain protein [Cordyceps fumosorosea ARSEF 2679]|uniref:NAD(P)-binding domain protein n=1 Tax=Cordyceps fumosorosea (strain ARSEF 2679) TaxID=1081104 RepID=A0A162MGG0_CORFA|nr:NAD(P)-binding domain protein [Cordyceps fumosorosea ARSEF 2679]OAA55760.1 NAD(P)-binding domain protein [Cordyceps fumosorosea ARSEF 2679]